MLALAIERGVTHADVIPMLGGMILCPASMQYSNSLSMPEHRLHGVVPSMTHIKAWERTPC